MPQAAAQASRSALAKGTFAITEVTVVPMTSDTILAGSTVLVRDGRIAAVGPSGSVKVPKDARRVDGKGRYLIPGLADMHTHLYSDDEVPDSVAPYELGVMVANGVTTARLMIGTPEHLVLRRELIDGRIVGPQLWVASPQFTGEEGTNARVVTEPDDARAAVREMRAAGYDFIKLTTEISPAGLRRDRGRGTAKRDPDHRPRGPAGRRPARARGAPADRASRQLSRDRARRLRADEELGLQLRDLQARATGKAWITWTTPR